jgi:pantoate--beta-alanine ligase
MKVVESLGDLRRLRESLPGPVGLVPTMGYLHAGHISLVKRARQECQSVVVSIYVNPTQFGPQEDLKQYPRNLQRDLEMLRSENVDLVWTPGDQVMYPPGFQTWVTVKEVTQPLEGSFRQGHFQGVATIVAKLFNAVAPQKAYFGQKDAQQVVVIKRMVRDLDFPIEIVVCPIVREADGLAMSSRNVYLGPDERKAATVLSRALFNARSAFGSGEQDADHLKELVLSTLTSEPMVKVLYVSCADLETLQELDGQVDHALISLAATVGKTHLIDNVIV